MLKRARLADSLNDHLIHRPGPLELVKKNILHAPTPIEQAIKGKLIRRSHEPLSALKGTSVPLTRAPKATWRYARMQSRQIMLPTTGKIQKSKRLRKKRPSNLKKLNLMRQIHEKTAEFQNKIA